MFHPQVPTSNGNKKDPCEKRRAWVMGNLISRRLKRVMQPPQLVILLIKDISNTISRVYLPMTNTLTVTMVDLAG